MSRAALHAAVEDDARAAAYGLGDLGQRVQAAEAVVDLASAVVRHPDVVHAVLDCDLGVLGRLHALEHERQPSELAVTIGPTVPGESPPASGARARLPTRRVGGW